MLRDVQNQYGSNLSPPFFLDFEKPHGFLAYALFKYYTYLQRPISIDNLRNSAIQSEEIIFILRK